LFIPALLFLSHHVQDASVVGGELAAAEAPDCASAASEFSLPPAAGSPRRLQGDRSAGARSRGGRRTGEGPPELVDVGELLLSGGRRRGRRPRRVTRLLTLGN